MSKAHWRNRIVGYSDEPPDQLLANPSNWRIHPGSQQAALAGALSEVGLVQNVIVNKTTGHVVDGHLRITLALRQGQPLIPVTWVELSEDEERYILATIDPLSAMATADAAALDALLSSVNSGDAAVQAMLGKLAADEGLYKLDPMAEWQGMPEFEQEDLTAYRSIHVHFKNTEHVQAFAELIGQDLSEKTRSVWYPKAEKIDMTPVYVDEQS